jgi:hypothetical protein
MNHPMPKWLPEWDPEPVNSPGEVLRGTLRREGDQIFLEADDGRRELADERIWHGYVEHFENRAVLARYLPEVDYEDGRPICIMWPDEEVPAESFVDIYYNERLVKYPASVLGHNAINVNGRIFNFSHRLNENEILTHEEYFYRPALGEFAPSPNNGRDEVIEGRHYLDKFGRRFMRTIHAVRMFGIDTERLGQIFDAVMERIHDPSSGDPASGKWRDFNPLTRNCTTVIRDGLNAYGLENVSGRFPRDLFVSAAYHLSGRQDLRVEILTLEQLKVVDAPYSAETRLLNPLNYWRQARLPVD